MSELCPNTFVGKLTTPLSRAKFASSPAIDREKFLRDLPRTDDNGLSQLFADIRERGIPYDNTTQTPAFEANNVSFLLSSASGFHSAVSGPLFRFSANIDFPWKKPAGTEDSPNASRWFVHVPPKDGKLVVIRQVRPMSSDGGRRQDRAAYWKWFYPRGTTFVEFARVHDESDRPFIFQVNALTRDELGWEPSIFRSELIADADGLLGHFGDRATGTPVTRTITDDDHPRRPRTFSASGLLYNIPKLPASELASSKFVPAPDAWAMFGNDKIVGVTTEEFSLVPKNFTGCLIPVSRQSCVQCHQDFGLHVNDFDRFGSQSVPNSGTVGSRHWYGTLRGNDGIGSRHFVSESAIAKNGASLDVSFRAGEVEVYNPDKHTVADYPGLKP